MRRLFVAAVVLAAALTACGSPAASTPHATTAAFSVKAATLKACKALKAWEHSDALGTFATSPQSGAIQLDADNTPLGGYLTNWVNDMENEMPYTQVEADANQVFAACGEVGIPILPN